jgi:hypothetical protein
LHRDRAHTGQEPLFSFRDEAGRVTDHEQLPPRRATPRPRSPLPPPRRVVSASYLVSLITARLGQRSQMSACSGMAHSHCECCTSSRSPRCQRSLLNAGIADSPASDTALTRRSYGPAQNAA